jgi:hypothetical protein
VRRAPESGPARGNRGELSGLFMHPIAAPSQGGGVRCPQLLTDKRCIHLRSASVRTYTFFTTGFPRFLSICVARRLQAFDLPLFTNLPKP